MTQNKMKKRLFLTVATVGLVGSAYVWAANDDCVSAIPDSLSYSLIYEKAIDFVQEEAQKSDLKVSAEILSRKDTVSTLPPLNERLFNDSAKLDQLESLPKAMDYLKNLKLNDELRQNLIKGVDSKIQMAKRAYRDFQPSLTDSLMSSFIGRRIADKISDLEVALKKALGSLQGEFESIYGVSKQATDLIDAETYAENVIQFLQNKKEGIRTNDQKSLFKHAAESLLIQKMGFTDFVVEEVIVRENGANKEFAGVVLYNKLTAQAILAMADGETKNLDILAHGNAEIASNIGLLGKAGHFSRYDKVHTQIMNVIDRLKESAKSQEQLLDVIAVGENNGSADAIQAAYNIKNRGGENVQVGMIGYNMQRVYEGPAAQKVEEALGKGNVVFNRQQTAIFDQHIAGLQTVGVQLNDAKAVKVENPTTAKEEVAATTTKVEAPATVKEEAPQGFFQRAYAWVASWF